MVIVHDKYIHKELIPSELLKYDNKFKEFIENKVFNSPFKKEEIYEYLKETLTLKIVEAIFPKYSYRFLYLCNAKLMNFSLREEIVGNFIVTFKHVTNK